MFAKNFSVFAENVSVFAKNVSVFAENISFFAKNVSVFAENVSFFAKNVSIFANSRLGNYCLSNYYSSMCCDSSRVKTFLRLEPKVAILSDSLFLSR
jgi:hypothetical protein